MLRNVQQMKTRTQSKAGGLTESAKSISYNQNRARVMARTNELLGLVSAGEAGARVTVMSGGSAWSPYPCPAAVYRSGGWGVSPAVYPSLSDRRAAAAGEGAAVAALGGEFVYRSFGAFCAALVPPWASVKVDAWAAGVAAGRAAVAVHEARRAAVAGLLSAAEVRAAHEAAAHDEAAHEAARAARRGLLTASEAANLHAVARWRRLGACLGYGEAVAMAALGSDRADIRRPWLEKLKVAAGRGIGEGWHTDQAQAAAAQYSAAAAAEVRAAAAGLFRLGLAGRAAARGARMAAAQARRWLRLNSRREALAVAEVGGAAGVDDMGAGADWSEELQSISGAVFQRAAACGVAALEAAAGWRNLAGIVPLRIAAASPWHYDSGECPAAAICAPCAALLAPLNSLVAMTAGGARAHLFGRGKRGEGPPVVEWTDKGRQVAEESLVVTGRGRCWVWASKQAGREMHAARYGRGGRDGREVPAGWRLNGAAAGDPLAHWGDSSAVECNLGFTAGLDSLLASFPETGDGCEVADISEICAPSADSPQYRPARRASVMTAARAFLAGVVRDARGAVRATRAAAMAATTAADRMAAGSALGLARRNLSAAASRARLLGGALRGVPIPPDVLAVWVERDARGERLTSAGKGLAKRVRDDGWQAAAVAASRLSRPAQAVGVVAGDEVAAALTIAPYAVV